MAFLQPYGTGFGSYGAFPQSYTFAPTAFAAPEHHSQAADGSEEHGSQAVSVSGFAADPNAALFGAAPFGAAPFGAAPFVYGGAPTVYGAHQGTVLPSTILPSTALVPVAAPQVRRPGYNERLVTWRNRQKAFNRYKKATKEAIKNANKQALLNQYGYPGFAPVAPTVYGGAVAPTAVYGAPFGATYLPAFGGAGFVYDQGFAAQAVPAENQEAYGNFGEFSQASQHQEAAEEPEIRGTQV